MAFRNTFKLTLALFIFLWPAAFSQSVGINTPTPDSSAILELESTTRGFLLPRMTTLERAQIMDPAIGLQIYNTDIDCLQFYTAAGWMNCCGEDADMFTQAYAGIDRMTILDTVHLQANTPGAGESGVWSIISGSGGSFSNDTLPDAIFMNNGNFETYILRWTISNPCGNTYDEIELRFHQPGVYVSILGSDATGDGSPANPYRTIQQGVNSSLGMTLDRVFISEGAYQESIAIASPSDTVRLIGGYYAHDWNTQDATSHASLVLGGPVAISVSNSGTNPVFVQDLNIYSSKAGVGDNSIVINVTNAIAIIETCVLNAGDGGVGLDGSDGVDGANGMPGVNGNSGSCFVQPSGGAGGLGGTTQVSGGNGGSGGDGDNVDAGFDGMSGNAGIGVNSGAGGAPGPGVGPCDASQCLTLMGLPDADSGTDGSDGTDGTGGAGYAVIAGNFLTIDGSNGTHGSGGGGGGGGGGCGELQNCNGSVSGYGHSGGGGGGGGGGGSAGAGGEGGGSSIGVLAFNSTVTVNHCIINRGYGGNGGNGGVGGSPGQGAAGGDGLQSVVGGIFSISGNGGAGGAGGMGGHGGGGSGGYSVGIASGNSVMTEMNNSFVGGTAGQGGKSIGMPGNIGSVLGVIN